MINALFEKFKKIAKDIYSERNIAGRMLQIMKHVLQGPVLIENTLRIASDLLLIVLSRKLRDCHGMLKNKMQSRFHVIPVEVATFELLEDFVDRSKKRTTG